MSGSITIGVAALRIVAIDSQIHVDYSIFCTRVAAYLTVLFGILALYRRLGYRAVRGELVALPSAVPAISPNAEQTDPPM